MAVKTRKTIKTSRHLKQMALIHGDMSSDVQSALRHLKQTMETITPEEWKKRQRRWEKTEAAIDSHGLVRNDYN